MGKITVYGDVLFLINFSMDFLVLFCTSRILHIKQKPYRLIIASVTGGAYAVGALFINNNVISVICNILVALFMCFIAYPKVRGLAYVKCAALFCGLSLLTGGGITASYVLLSKLGHGVDINSGVSPVLSDIPLGTFCVLGLISVAASYITGKIFNKGKGKREITVTVVGKNGKATLKCLSDSGALLCEPLSGAPVMITKPENIKDCVTAELYSALCSPDLSVLAEGIRLIPSRSAGGEKLLCGFVPEHIYVKGTDRRAVVAVASDIDFGGFDGIVPSAITD